MNELLRQQESNRETLSRFASAANADPDLYD